MNIFNINYHQKFMTTIIFKNDPSHISKKENNRNLSRGF